MLQVQRYDYKDINLELISSVVKDVDFLYTIKHTKQTEPNQTLDSLFTETSPVWNSNWKILRDTFNESIYKFLGISFPNCKSWVYASFAQTPQTYGHRWHIHPHSKFSGIMYLTLPLDKENEPCFTTEFLNDNRSTTFVEPVIGSWFICDSRQVHRTGYWKYQEMYSNRYCLVASVY